MIAYMHDTGGEAVLATSERLEQAFEEAWEIGRTKPNQGGPLNAFLGTEELMSMGRHLIEHMRDEARWGEPNMSFEPIDFVLAAHDVAHDQTIGSSKLTRTHVHERVPFKMTFDIFIGFWLPRIASFAYGEQYGSDVNSILQNVTPPA